MAVSALSPASRLPAVRPLLTPTSRSPFDAGPFTYAPRYGSSPRPWPRYWGSGGYGYVAPYEFGVESPPSAEPHNVSSDLASDGALELDVEPRSADVYADGFYVGAVGDLLQNGLTLRAGRHWIDARAPGFQTLSVPVNITAGEVVRYRGALAPAAAIATRAEPPRGAQTMYVIPGCYAGNRPPTESTLAGGCDITRLRVLDNPQKQ